MKFNFKRFIILLVGYIVIDNIFDSLPLMLRNLIILLFGVAIIIYFTYDIYKLIKYKKYTNTLQIVIANIAVLISFSMILYFGLSNYYISIPKIVLGITSYIVFLIAIVKKSFLINKGDNEGVE